MAFQLRIKVVGAPPGVLVGVQKGKGSAGRPHDTKRTDAPETVFEIEVQTKDARLSGPFVQKDAKGQFVYLVWGKSAGDFASPWQRRAKIYLRNLPAGAISDGNVVTVVIQGTAKDGGPACATVPSTLE